MTSLTRRRDPDSREETWLIFYGDVRLGAIGRRSGNPPGTLRLLFCQRPGDESHGTAAT